MCGQQRHIDRRLARLEPALALGELRPQRLEVEARLARLREYGALLFVDVMLDIFRQYLEARREQIVGRFGCVELAHELLQVAVLDVSFIERVVESPASRNAE